MKLNSTYGVISTEIHYTDPDVPWMRGVVTLIGYDVRLDRHLADHFIVG